MPTAPDALTRRTPAGPVRDLVVVLGDQLTSDYATIRDLDPKRDAVVMMEVREESTRTPSSKQRTAYFLSAMRTFAGDLADRGLPLRYVSLDDDANTGSFEGEIARAIDDLGPERVRVVEPGARRVLETIEDVCDDAATDLDVLPDTHFLCSTEEFMAWRDGRKTLVMEHFYRSMRKKHDILMDGSEPAGGEWNYDKQNRKAFRRAPRPPAPYVPRHGDVVARVIGLVNRELPDLPGELSALPWPVSRDQARRALAKFIDDRLPRFGDHQDAMWTGESTLHHALLSPALNLKLLDPREVIRAAVARRVEVPLNALEGFVRQILGWREFVRGVYWTEPGYESLNSLRAQGALPEAYWTGDSDMRCVRECVGPVLERGHSHHIQRLMVTGNLALTAGVHPDRVDDWYLGMFVDGVEWATIPNARGMSQHADGGVVGTKPYASTGAYVKRMSNYCEHCRYAPTTRTGDDACPLTTLYWDFLLRHKERFGANNRMAMMMKHVEKIGPDERGAIRDQAKHTRVRLGVLKGDS